jgi:Cu-processing system permease protein
MNQILSVAKATFFECARSAAIVTTVLAGVASLTIALVFGTVSIGSQSLVAKDIGLAITTLFPVLFVLIAGSSLLHKEFTRKTIYTILAKPISRETYLWGKFLGLVTAAQVAVVVLFSVTAAIVLTLEGTLTLALLHALVRSMVECALVGALVIFFSSISVTPALIGTFSGGLFLAGRSLEYIREFIATCSGSPVVTRALNVLSYVIPPFQEVNANAIIAAGLTPTGTVWAALLGGLYAIPLVVVATLCYARRDFP